MIVSAVDDSNARVTAHEQIENLLAVWGNTCGSQSFFNDR